VTARLIVQGVDVLRNQTTDAPGALQTGQRIVRHIRQCQAHMWPAEHRPRPVASTRLRGREEFLVHHRLSTATHALVVAVIRYARRRADAGTGQHHKRLVGHQLMEPVELFADPTVEHVQHSGEGLECFAA